MLLSSTLSILMFCTLCLFSAGLGLGLNPNHFDSEVQGDDRVWVIEFFSKMCGSCQEFAPTWSKLKKKLPSFRVAEVDIDQKAGMQLAEKLGVLEEGIPCLRLFHSKSQPNGISVLNSKYRH